MKIAHETDNLTLGVSDNEFETLGQILAMATLTKDALAEPVFTLGERAIGAVGAQRCLVAYEKIKSGKDTTLIPFGYVIWATVSPPVAAILGQNLRPLAKDEYNSGSEVWILDVCAPYGNRVEIYEAWQKAVTLGNVTILHNRVIKDNEGLHQRFVKEE